MRLAPRIRVLMVVLALVLLVAGGVPGPSVSAAGLAATPGPVDYGVGLVCNISSLFPPANFLSCFATVGGGVAPYTYIWSSDSTIVGVAAAGASFTGFCIAGNRDKVSVQVTDFRGNVTSAVLRFTC